MTDQSSNRTDISYPSANAAEGSLLFNFSNSIEGIRATVDGLGRPILTQKRQGPSASYYDTVETDYDAVGRVSKGSLPFSSTAGTTSSTAKGVTYSYDALGRVLTASDSGGGVVTYTYSGNDTYQSIAGQPTGEDPKRKQLQYDALGRLTSVCEVTENTDGGSCAQTSSATGHWTTYAYDPLGNLTGVTQNAQASQGQQTRTYTYDRLGRMTSEQNPETNNQFAYYAYDSLSSDSACGTVTSPGNLVKRVDAAGQATCYLYDDLHRVTSITYPSSSTPAKKFVYDVATVNGIPMTNVAGRLAEAYTCTTCPGTKITDLGFSYSARGEVAEVYESTPHSGGYYHYSATYRPNGIPYQLFNLPGGLPTFTYGANAEGQISTVSASAGQNPVTSLTRNVAGQVTNVTYGSSDTDVFAFDPNTFRMTGFTYNVGTGPVKSYIGGLTWNANGTLQALGITDPFNAGNSQTCAYGYDDLARIASANCGASIWSQTFSFDAFGNLSKTVPQGSTGMTFQPTYDPLTNRILSSPFTYNGNNGALTNDGIRAYGWDAENRMTTVDPGLSTGVCLTYDALGRVVEEGTGSTCTSSFAQYVYGPSGQKLMVMSGQNLQKALISLPGGATAVYKPNATLGYYRHSDWLGSARLSTTPARAPYYDVSYAAYGEDYNGYIPSGGAVALAFTGQTQDTTSGAYDFLFREYRAAHGRWISPDPAGLNIVDPSSPQSWNRYAYVINLPTAAIDALGLDSSHTTCADPWFAVSHAQCAEFPNVGSGFSFDVAFDFGYKLGRGGGGFDPALGAPSGFRFPMPSLGDLLGLPQLCQTEFGAPCEGEGIPGAMHSFGTPINQTASLMDMAHILGVDKTYATCTTIHGEPTRFGTCTFLCEGSRGVLGGAEIGMARLMEKCGPITKCPNIIEREDRVFWLFGFGFPLEPRITMCSPNGSVPE